MITPYVGGGFGGKSAGRQAVEAARLAAAVGQPVQVAWTRAEEFFYDTFDPAAVVKVTSAVDPNGKIALWDARMQMEGCVTMGLGYVLTEEVPFQGGEVRVRGFDGYHLPRFSMLPKIETVLVRNDDVAPQGAGEPAIVPLGAAVANALFDATGIRAYRLPLTPERVRGVLNASASGS